MKRKTKLKEVEDKILEIIENSWPSPLSIREVKKRLKEDYGIGVSPILVKGCLLKLKREGKIE